MQSLRRLAIHTCLFLGIFLGGLLAASKAALAANSCSPSFPSNVEKGTAATITFSIPDYAPSDQLALCPPDILTRPAGGQSDKYCFQIRWCNTNLGGTCGCKENSTCSFDNAQINSAGRTISVSQVFNESTTFWLEEDNHAQGRNRTCASTEWQLAASYNPRCEDGVFSITNESGSAAVKASDNVVVKIDPSKTKGFFPDTLTSYSLSLADPNNQEKHFEFLDAINGNVSQKSSGNTNPFSVNMGKLGIGDWKLYIKTATLGSTTKTSCEARFTLSDSGIKKTTDEAVFSLCEQVTDTDRAACLKCFGAGAGNDKASDSDKPTKIWTAFGCVPTDPAGMVQGILQIGLAMSGGVVVLTILAGAFMLATSAGNTKQVEEAQQMISSAVIGLLFIIFSVIILQFFGVGILHLPGFGT